MTGFGFLGHLSEMINSSISAEIDSISIPVIKGAMHCAEEFLLTAAAQRNRNHVAERVTFSKYIPFAMEELLFDPQTSGGLLDGYTATRRIRGLSRPDAQSIPIIALTANAFAEDRKKAMEAGMNDHVAKPVDMKVLTAVLQKYLEK